MSRGKYDVTIKRPRRGRHRLDRCPVDQDIPDAFRGLDTLPSRDYVDSRPHVEQGQPQVSRGAAMTTVQRSLRMRHRDDKQSPEQRLRWIAFVFLVAVAVHGADHVRRGMDVVTTQVMWAG